MIKRFRSVFFVNRASFISLESLFFLETTKQNEHKKES